MPAEPTHVHSLGCTKCLPPKPLAALSMEKADAFAAVLDLLAPLKPKDRQNVLRAACVFFEVEP